MLIPMAVSYALLGDVTKSNETLKIIQSMGIDSNPIDTNNNNNNNTRESVGLFLKLQNQELKREYKRVKEYIDGFQEGKSKWHFS